MLVALLLLLDISSSFLLPSISLPPCYFLFDDSDVFGFNVCAQCAEHFEVDEEHAFGSAFGFEEGAFVAVEEATDDLDAVALFQFHFIGTEVGDVVLHLGRGVDEAFHFAGGHLENLEFAVQLLVAVGDEGVLVLQRIHLAEGGEDEDGVGDDRTFHNHLFAVDGCVCGSHGAVGAHAGILHHFDGECFLAAHLEGEPFGLVL